QDSVTYVVAQPRTDELMRGRGAVMPPNPLTTWLEQCGVWGTLAQEKHFPACVWTWSQSYLAEFLRVLMSCDGAISTNAHAPRIDFTAASPQLAADVHHAFVRFGIVAKLYRTTHGAWRVEMTDPASVERYQQEIGWIGEKATRCTDF